MCRLKAQLPTRLRLMPTTDTIPHSDAYNWIISPITRCIMAVGNTEQMSGLLQRAVIALADQKPMAQRLEGLLRGLGASHLLKSVEENARPNWSDKAAELLENELHEVHVPMIIALWASLEVAVEDTATLILLNDTQALADVVQAGVKVPSKCSLPLDDFNARRVFNRLEQFSRKTRNIAQGYAHALYVLGVPSTIESTVFATLAELNYVRNCILHRGGIVDSRVTLEAPSSGLAVGNEIRVRQEQFSRYYKAVGSFATEILKGTIDSRHARYKEQST